VTGWDFVLVGFAAGLVIVASLLAGMEAALSRVSRVRVEELVREQPKRALKLQTVLADPPRYLNLLLLLRTAAELAATVAVAAVCLDVLTVRWQALLAAAAIMTVVSYVVVGVAPRTLGQQHAPGIALRAAGVTLALTRVLGPLPRLLILIGNALTPGKGFREGPFASEAELRDLVDLAEERQVIEHDERQMIHSVFELGDTLVREVMVPRPDMVFIESNKTVRQALALALRSGFSRIPVIGTNVDDIIGVAYLKDLVRRSQESRYVDGRDKVEAIMRPPTFVPDSKPVDELLREMQAAQIHIAVVIDEYGGTAGLVTIEDILEEIVGEIADEYDQETPPIELVDERTTRVTARLPVDEVAEMYDVELAVDDVETVGGLLASALGRVPIPGATVSLEGLTFTAESAKGRRNRIGTVLITRGDGAERPAGQSGSGEETPASVMGDFGPTADQTPGTGERPGARRAERLDEPVV
jgi:CBS domain containing-hemolysin-like protein